MTAILMLNWNGASDTLECIDSLRRVESDYFCVVADNGSADDSVARIEKYFQDENLAHRIVNEGDTLTEDEVNAFCMELPRYKRPRKIIFAPVPRNATGKIEKPKLREIYGASNLVDAENRS